MSDVKQNDFPCQNAGTRPPIYWGLDMDEVIRLYNEGFRPDKIAEIIKGISGNTIRNRLRELGYTFKAGRPRKYETPPPQSVYPAYQRRLKEAREHTAQKKKHEEALKVKREASRALADIRREYPLDRRLRPLKDCKKGHCKWLKPVCLRDPATQDRNPCPFYDDPNSIDCRKDLQGSWCRHYRAPCNRRFHNCPYGWRIYWRCENCTNLVSIAEIHFVTESGTRPLQEQKMQGSVRYPERQATALCTDCLEQYREHRSSVVQQGRMHPLMEKLKLW